MRRALLLIFVFATLTLSAQDSILITVKIPNPCITEPPKPSDSLLIPITSTEITPNIYKNLGYSDTKKIQLALNDAIALRKRLIIGYNDERANNLWLIDSAILLNSNTDILIKNAKLKLTDSSRDNIFRTANCGFGITSPELNPVENISIVGNGNAILEGADNPRSSGDYNKTLTLNPDYSYTQSYGTDAGKVGRSQKGDWRNYGVIIAYATNVKVTGISLNYLHAYGISFQRTNHVHINDINIKMPGYAANGDPLRRVFNNGAIDFDQRILNATIQNVYGECSDDVIALNILNIPANGAGSYNAYYAIGDTSNTLRDSVSNVVIKNVAASSYSNVVRCLLPSNNVTSKNVTITNITNTVSPEDVYYPIAGTNTSCISLGSTNSIYGGANTVGQFSNFFISNVKSDYTKYGVNIITTLANSTISDVVKNSATYITTSAVTYTDQNKIKNVVGINAGSANISFNDVLNTQPTLSVINPNIAANAQSRISLIIGSDKGTGIAKGASISTKTPLGFNFADYENRPFNLYLGNGAAAAIKLTVATNGNAVLNGTITATQFKLSALNTEPASSIATGTTGEIRIVNGFIYVCVGTNTWQRATLSTF